MKRSTKLLIQALLVSSVLYTVAFGVSDSEWKIQNQMNLPAKATVLAYSSDAGRIAVGHPDGRVSVWNVKSGELVKLIIAHTKEVNSVQFIRQDSQLLTIGDDYRAHIWS